MKILFFLALLINIVVFLWEYNSGALNSVATEHEIKHNNDNQILLLSELESAEKDKALVLANNDSSRFDSDGFSKVHANSELGNQESDNSLINVSISDSLKSNKDNFVLNANQPSQKDKTIKIAKQDVLNNEMVKTVIKNNPADAQTLEVSSLQKDIPKPAKENELLEVNKEQFDNKITNNKAVQPILNQNVVKTIEELALNSDNQTAVAENPATKLNLNTTDKALTKSKVTTDNNLVTDLSIPPQPNKSLTEAIKDSTKVKNDAVNPNSKDLSLKKENAIKIDEKMIVSVEKKFDQQPPLNTLKANSKISNLAILKSKEVDNSVQAKQASKPVVSDLPTKETVVNSAIKHPETKVNNENLKINTIIAADQHKKVNLKKPELAIHKTINNSKISEQARLPTKLQQTDLSNTQCYDIGPFQSDAEIKVWAKQNNMELTSTRLVKQNISNASSFLIYYPAAKNFEESKKNVQILKRMGITDYWLFLKGDLKGAISLGLFTKESRALRFKKKLSNLGLDVKIKPRYKTETVFYTQILSKDKKFKEMLNISKMQTILNCKT